MRMFYSLRASIFVPANPEERASTEKGQDDNCPEEGHLEQAMQVGAGVASIQVGKGEKSWCYSDCKLTDCPFSVANHRN